MNSGHMVDIDYLLAFIDIMLILFLFHVNNNEAGWVWGGVSLSTMGEGRV